MQTRPSTVLSFAAFGLGSVFLAALGGCSTTPAPTTGNGTDYLREPEATHYRSSAPARHSDDPVTIRQQTADQPAKHTEASGSAADARTHAARSKKVESEIGETSDIQIDPETRRQMNAGGEKSKPKKVEAEVRDPSDLQIDEQTKKKMDGGQ